MRILVVSWAWPPIGRIGSLRPMGMAREWVSLGHEVLVVTGPGDRGGEYSPDLVAEAEDIRVEVHRVSAPNVPKPAFLRGPDKLGLQDLVEAKHITAARRILSQWRHFPGRERSWIRPATNAALELHRRMPLDLVWTTSPPEAVHFVGRRLERHGIPWVADFRDPWADYQLAGWDPLSRWIINRLTGRLLRRTSLISACTEGMAASIRRTTDRRVLCVRNGFDYYAKRPARPRESQIGYFGRVDPRLQSLKRMWDPLRILRDTGDPWRLQVYLSGGGGGGARVLVPDDLLELVQIHPPLVHSLAFERMREMTGLLVLPFEYHSGSAIVPGKLYEYAGAGVPALVCAPKSYEVRRLAEAKSIGVGGWTRDEIVAAVRRLPDFTIDEDSRLTLSRKTAARLLAEEFRRLKPAGPRTS